MAKVEITKDEALKIFTEAVRSRVDEIITPELVVKCVTEAANYRLRLLDHGPAHLHTTQLVVMGIKGATKDFLKQHEGVLLERGIKVDVRT